MLTFSDLALARRLERAEGRASAAFVDARARMFPETGAAWVEVGSAFAMFDGPDSPLTQTFALGMDGAVTASDFERIEEFYARRHAPVHHEVSPLADPSVLALLNGRRYQVLEFSSVLWRTIQIRDNSDGDAQGIAQSVTARPIRDDEHDLWARIAAAGWSHVPELTPFLLGLGRINEGRTNHVPFLAEIDGAAVAAGGIAIHEGVALLAGASTIPMARRRGAQRALLEARLRYAAAAGCDIAMMGAAPGSESQRNAERQGFRIAYTRVKWRQAQGS